MRAERHIDISFFPAVLCRQLQHRNTSSNLDSTFKNPFLVHLQEEVGSFPLLPHSSDDLYRCHVCLISVSAAGHWTPQQCTIANTCVLHVRVQQNNRGTSNQISFTSAYDVSVQPSARTGARPRAAAETTLWTAIEIARPRGAFLRYQYVYHVDPSLFNILLIPCACA